MKRRRHQQMRMILVGSGVAAMLVAFAPLSRSQPETEQNSPAHQACGGPSVFRIPSTLQEGRNPFYPESTRHMRSVVVPTNTVPDVIVLRLAGISGTPGKRLALINNRTLAAGEKADVLTPQGRISVRCIEVGEDTAIIEVNSQRRELRLRADL